MAPINYRYTLRYFPWVVIFISYCRSIIKHSRSSTRPTRGGPHPHTRSGLNIRTSPHLYFIFASLLFILNIFFFIIFLLSFSRVVSHLIIQTVRIYIQYFVCTESTIFPASICIYSSRRAAYRFFIHQVLYRNIKK